jgi:hypothetical protein
VGDESALPGALEEAGASLLAEGKIDAEESDITDAGVGEVVGGDLADFVFIGCDDGTGAAWQVSEDGDEGEFGADFGEEVVVVTDDDAVGEDSAVGVVGGDERFDVERPVVLGASEGGEAVDELGGEVGVGADDDFDAGHWGWGVGEGSRCVSAAGECEYQNM